MNNFDYDIIYKYFLGNTTVDELDELEIWLAEDTNNKQTFNSLKTAWLSSNAETKYAQKGKSRVLKNIRKKTNSFDNSQKITLLSYQVLSRAAIFVLAIGLGAILMLISQNKVFNSADSNFLSQAEYNDTILIEAENGSQSEIVLPDGTKVWLNSGSNLKFQPTFFAGERVVYLEGEGFFNVTKSDENFFRVVTSDIQIKVLGTEFNVKSYPEEGTIETTLEEGSVVIEKQMGEKLVDIATLKPNETAIFVKKDGRVSLGVSGTGDENIERRENIQTKESLLIKENVDTKLRTSWKEGQLIFKDEIFENIVRQMERRYDVEINLKNRKLKELRFTVNFKNETIEQALDALKLTHRFDYAFDLKNNLITIE